MWKSWYKHALLEYDEYIEDTIYCNNRSIYEYGKFNANGGRVTNTYFDELYFAGVIDNTNQNLFCIKDTDRFSTLNQSALLNYKVGLITAYEAYLVNNGKIVRNGSNYWTMTPVGLGSYLLTNYYVDSTWENNRYLTGDEVRREIGVRPVISLRPGIEYTDGDGSMEHPYVIDTN